ncbi:ROK family glucokinase [Alkalihalobacillus sp. MEB130]|uniref:ROK family glucokinase n=1 Tax=Alkalihalobacillus sp. MEB130 TaxID=2976704 RepID=UPI0028DF7DF1|nr:ROK family glucokinase [Alkalihalobacillus sp. MEB130]MDT8860217.1 ROK family glucokinase [Alkalihalobacillus sp. MEB130]
MNKVIGIDLGGTTIKFAILTEEGEIQEKWSIKTDIQNAGKNIVPSMIETINEHLDIYKISANEVLGIGMGSPGSVNPRKGTVIGAYNLNWSSLQPVKEQMEAGTKIPFFIDNDANVAALGERWKGAGANGSNVTFITLGTGVGGGIIAEGNLVHGIEGCGGEIGHMHVEPNGYQCTCGNYGCLETVASATGVVRLARDLSEDYQNESELKMLIENGQEITAKTVFDQAKRGDKLAAIIVDTLYYYLGLACSNIANLLNPEFIVIGGGVSAAGDMLLEGVVEYFQQFAFPQVRTSTKIKLAQLGNDAGVIGAGSLVIQNKVVRY